MEISITVLKDLEKILNLKISYLQAQKKNLYTKLNTLITYYQKINNKVYEEDEIRMIITFYRLLLLIKGLNLPHIKKFLYTELSINFLVEDYLKEKRISIKISDMEIKDLDIKKIFKKNIFFDKEKKILNGNLKKFNNFFLDSKILMVYNLFGAVDHLFIIYLSDLINTKTQYVTSPLFFKNFNKNLLKISKDLFDVKLFDFFNKEFDYEKYYFNYVNKKDKVILHYILDNFYFYLLDSSEKIKHKICKLLFLGLNCFKDNRLIESIELLNKLFSENLYFKSNPNSQNFSYLNINSLSKQKLLKNNENHIILVNYRKKININEFRFFTEMYPLNLENLNFIQGINSPIIDISILNNNLELLKSHKLLKPEKLDRSFFYLREKDFFNCDFENFSQFKGKSSMIIDILSNNHIEIAQLKKKTAYLKEKNLNLFTVLNFKELKKCKDNFQITKFVQKTINPLENFHLLKLLTNNLIKFSKKYNLTGFFFQNFTSCFKFAHIKNQKFYSLEDLQRKIYEQSNEDNKSTFYKINKKIRTYQNPFLVYITHKFLKVLPNFQIITSNHPELVCLGNIYFIKDFSNNDLDDTKNYLNFLNSQFYKKIFYYPINLNLLLEVKVHKNILKNNLLKVFFKFLKNLFNVSFIFDNKCIEKESFSSSNVLAYNNKIKSVSFTTFYFPLIFKNNEDNNLLGCFTYNENVIHIFIKRIEPSKDNKKVEISLRALYFFFKRKNLKLIKFVNFINKGKEKKYYFYEILNNKLKVKVDMSYKGEIKFILDKEEENKEIIHDDFKINYNYQKIYEFFQLFEKSKCIKIVKNIDFDFYLEKFLDLLFYFKIDDITKLEKFIRLTQISSNKENYQLILLLLKKIISKKEENNFPITIKDLNNFINSKKLNKIAIITPEYAKFIKVGGLAVMIEDLVEELKNYGEELIIIMPYYNYNKKGKTDYLKDKGAIHIYNLEINLHNVDYNIGVSFLKEKNITYFFLHNYYLFPKIYTYFDKEHQMKQISIFNLASMKVLEKEKEKPSIILTNDWFAGLSAAYAKSHFFNNYFEKSKFVHLIHNIGEDYQGRIYLKKNESGLISFISGLNSNFFIDPYWTNVIVNPCRCAIMASDQWTTVSKSYRKEILDESCLNFLLKKFEQPFAFPNGVRSVNIKKKLENLDTHKNEKINLIKKYFGYEFLDKKKYDEYILFGFVGRITEQKGVLLMLDVFETLLEKHNNKILFIIGGMIDNSKYSHICAKKMFQLKNDYPKNFWGDPSLFFTEGTILNKGADFFLMPSKFEPGGIVQHESLIAGTPVIAFKTGGLQDTIFEYLPYSSGNGFNFINYKEEDFIYSIERAINCYKDKNSYLKLRKNCKSSFIEVNVTARAWRGEFYRLYNIVN